MSKPPRKPKPPKKAAPAAAPRRKPGREPEACDDRAEAAKAGAGRAAKRDEAAGAAGPRDQTPDAETEEKFLETLVATGLAAPVDEKGKLPPGATHELVETEEGKLKAVRKRFSIY